MEINSSSPTSILNWGLQMPSGSKHRQPVSQHGAKRLVSPAFDLVVWMQSLIVPAGNP